MRQAVTAVRAQDLAEDGVSLHRGNPRQFSTLPIDTGVTGVNLKWTLSTINDFYSPRHRHNFEQIRYTVKGSYNSGKQTMKEGQVGYFPEGCYYGPQDQHGACLLLVLQFPGPSDAYYLLQEELDAAYGQLKARGTFEGGIFTVVDADGKKTNKDSFEAIWEEHQQRPLEYPRPRYGEPIIIEPANMTWRPDPVRAGVEVKHLGTFGEDRTAIEFVRWRPGASVEPEMLEAPEARYVVNGTLTYGGDEFGPGSYFYIPAETPTAASQSSDGAELLAIRLPMIVRRAQETRQLVTA